MTILSLFSQEAKCDGSNATGFFKFLFRSTAISFSTSVQIYNILELALIRNSVHGVIKVTPMMSIKGLLRGKGLPNLLIGVMIECKHAEKDAALLAGGGLRPTAPSFHSFLAFLICL